MSEHAKPRNILIRNLANIVSFFGVLPICLLFGDNGYSYLIPLMLYNNIMDDLDGILAGKLGIRSPFGALLDNVCDVAVHGVFAMVVGMHFAEASEFSFLGSVCLVSSLCATVAIIIRIVTRINPAAITGTGTATNELVRHLFFVLILGQHFGVDPVVYLIPVFFLHTVSMLVPFKMPYLIRSLTKSATAVGLVNVALLAAWLFPVVAPVIAALFGGSYLVSFVLGAFCWFRRRD